MSDARIALVTGASRGIGKAIAEKLMAEGYTVCGTATTESGAAAIDGWINGLGLAMNVTDGASVEAALARITSELGPVAVLVNNAGITRDTLMLRMKDDDWSDVIQTNLTSVFSLSKAVLKGMTKARWGRIVNISSVVGSMGNAGQANYAAAKAGIEGFSRAMAREVGSRNITVNSVAPGFIATDMTDALGDEQKNTLASQIPLGRLGQPQDIANAVAYLVGESGAYVTGTTLHVNGGMLMN
ncbi:3-oxoacyl-ACP reductase FabG [Litorivicinus lipolyticus]|jgi:3-oxoacyl-[acyl-carrier protein] reductase|uniref:3-oxoacyl-ACP reductase FabG n=1 Tax=Litorivicinus lipolyticus TaxID=418701 RepID=UPI003B59DF7B